MSAAGHHGIETRLIDGELAEIGIVPGGDALSVEINHRHLDVRAAIGNWAGLRSQPEGAGACRAG